MGQLAKDVDCQFMELHSELCPMRVREGNMIPLLQAAATTHATHDLFPCKGFGRGYLI